MPDEHIGGGLVTEAKIIEGEETLPANVDLGSRFTDWRTLLSFGLALVILVFALKKAGVNHDDLKHSLSKANPGSSSPPSWSTICPSRCARSGGGC